MGTRLELHDELLTFSTHVYFQPPEGIQMKYPCIVYHKSPKLKRFGNDSMYLSKQGYNITVIDKNPDSIIADTIESHFRYCSINGYFINEGLNHTTLKLYY